MIVKNEANVLARCLASVRPLIDHWVIVDTGSSDATMAIAAGELADLPGSLHERPWRDFATNRNEALELARSNADYVLHIDADDQLECTPDAPAEIDLTADAYELAIKDGGVRYKRTQIVRSGLPWRWRGVLHEFLDCSQPITRELLRGVEIRRNHDGARRKASDTYRRDAEVLEAALDKENDPFLRSRYVFYLAQSYRDCGDIERAAHWYEARALLGHWQEEVFVSLYRKAQMRELLGHDVRAVIAEYLDAARKLPSRAESLHAASRLCRINRYFDEGYRIAALGAAIPLPSSGLFVETWIYETGLLDELAVNAYWSGRYRECLDACIKLLGSGLLPRNDLPRVTANALFALEKLSPAAVADVSQSSQRSSHAASLLPLSPALA